MKHDSGFAGKEHVFYSIGSKNSSAGFPQKNLFNKKVCEKSAPGFKANFEVF